MESEKMQTLVDEALDRMEKSSKERLEWDKKKYQDKKIFWAGVRKKATGILVQLLVAASLNLIAWVVTGFLYFGTTWQGHDWDTRSILYVWRPVWFTIQACITILILTIVNTGWTPDL